MPRTIKKPEERRQEIIVTALELFAENGYDNTTIQDIANRLGIATGLCYHY
ncbi:helix-turn-helix domain-containing protein, partial [Blautia coccoides]|uniref:TetR/AcrR family transcriptional regulator n=1 Tax=Blautia producta TaxID=33035 RepID=UPI0035185518